MHSSHFNAIEVRFECTLMHRNEDFVVEFCGLRGSTQLVGPEAKVGQSPPNHYLSDNSDLARPGS